MSSGSEDGDFSNKRGSIRSDQQFDSTLAKSFAEQLDGAFSLDENLSNLSDTIANKHLTLQSQSRELEELQARIRAAEEALERATSNPEQATSNGQHNAHDLWAGQSGDASDSEDDEDAVYAEARAVAGTGASYGGQSVLLQRSNYMAAGSHSKTNSVVGTDTAAAPTRAAPIPPSVIASQKAAQNLKVGTGVASVPAPGRAAPAPPPSAPPGRRAPVPGRRMDYESSSEEEDDDDDDDDDDDEEDEEEEDESEDEK